jgi:coenzyme Q-binding protein COQ10
MPPGPAFTTVRVLFWRCATHLWRYRLAVVIEKATRLLPFSREQVFDLAANIERYPEFLRGWISVRIRKRESNICYVDQVVGLGPVRVQFSSKAVLLRPERIDVISWDPPFRRFGLSWVIEARPSGGCTISIVADLELRSRLLQKVADRVLPDTVGDIILAFEARARRLYTVLEKSVDQQIPPN